MWKKAKTYVMDCLIGKFMESNKKKKKQMFCQRHIGANVIEFRSQVHEEKVSFKEDFSSMKIQ